MNTSLYCTLEVV